MFRWAGCEQRMMNYMTQKVQKDFQRRKEANDQRIQRVLDALLGKDAREDFLQILEYYQDDKALANYAMDRSANPENY